MRPILKSKVRWWLKSAQITYDLNQVAPNEVFALRDTLLAALQAYKTGPRSIIVQLSLALAGLAVQLPTWGNAVQMMIEHFGQNPETVPLLLEFLTVLPEELNNYKIPITVRMDILVNHNVALTTNPRMKSIGSACHSCSRRMCLRS